MLGRMSTPLIGQRYRGVDGHSGYLLRQACNEFRGAMELGLRAQGLTPAQYVAMSVLARDPGVSGADLARACNTTPQATNGVLATLEREGLVERHAHPTHGRILQVDLTDEGHRRLELANPGVRQLEAAIEDGFTPDQMAAIKRWLVLAGQRLERIAAEQRSQGPPSHSSA
jgi:DNA-binding MarR family transcriptional regulator